MIDSSDYWAFLVLSVLTSVTKGMGYVNTIVKTCWTISQYTNQVSVYGCDKRYSTILGVSRKTVLM